MDNLQKHYLQRLLYARQLAVEGFAGSCIDICFELRLLPAIALYTRGLVCLTLADLLTAWEYPNKMSFAIEAVRIANELQVCECRQFVLPCYHISNRSNMIGKENLEQHQIIFRQTQTCAKTESELTRC